MSESRPSSHFKNPISVPKLPPDDDVDLLKWDDLAAHIPQTRLFSSSSPQERAAMMDVIECRYEGKLGIHFIKALNAIADGIAYVNRNKYNSYALQNIDPRMVDGTVNGVTLTIAFTTLCEICKKSQKLAINPPAP